MSIEVTGIIEALDFLEAEGSVFEGVNLLSDGELITASSVASDQIIKGTSGDDPLLGGVIGAGD